MQEPLAKPTFAEVARIISKGKPPDWLVTGLERFSGGIGVETDRDLLRHVEQLRGATNVLMKLLPAFQHMPFNIKSPSHVDVIRQALPLLKKDLERIKRRPPGGIKRKFSGRPPNTQREICAAVIVESWTIMHGKPEPRSRRLERACADYWQVCGGKMIDSGNWRRIIKLALQTDHKWVREVLLAVQNEG
jgi:hypothetical protein